MTLTAPLVMLQLTVIILLATGLRNKYKYMEKVAYDNEDES